MFHLAPLFAVLAPHFVAFFTPHLAFVTPLVVLHALVFLTIAAIVFVVRAVVVRARSATAAQPQKCRCQNRCDAYQGLHGCSFGPDSRTRERALAFNPTFPNVANVNDRGARDSRRNLQ
jgi:hypothetical protein